MSIGHLDNYGVHGEGDALGTKSALQRALREAFGLVWTSDKLPTLH